MRIKLNTAAIIGTNQNPRKAGSVVEVDEAEGNALIAAGYAAETKAKVTDESEEVADTINSNLRLPAGTTDSAGNTVTTATDNASANTEANAAGVKRATAGKPAETK